MNIYLYPADGVNLSSVEYLEEARRLLDAADSDTGEPLIFDDISKTIRED